MFVCVFLCLTVQQIVLYQILSGMTPYAFVRRSPQLVSFVVEEDGRPDINESWPSLVRSMMKDSFNADVDLRPVSSHDFICRGRKEIEVTVLTPTRVSSSDTLTRICMPGSTAFATRWSRCAMGDGRD